MLVENLVEKYKKDARDSIVNLIPELVIELLLLLLTTVNIYVDILYKSVTSRI